MGKNTTKVFVINANDKAYILGEEHNDKLFGKIYSVYCDDKIVPYEYPTERFWEEYGATEKMFLSTFLTKAEVGLAPLGYGNAKIDATRQMINKINPIISNDSLNCPSIGKFKHTILKIIRNYNDIIDNTRDDIEIDHTKEFNLITGRKTIKDVTSKHETRERLSVMSISNSYEDQKGMQRAKKYDYN